MENKTAPQHLPGPWKVHKNAGLGEAQHTILTARPEQLGPDAVAWLTHPEGMPESVRDANAQLMAQAPAMALELKKVRSLNQELATALRKMVELHECRVGRYPKGVDLQGRNQALSVLAQVDALEV